MEALDVDGLSIDSLDIDSLVYRFATPAAGLTHAVAVEGIDDLARVTLIGALDRAAGRSVGRAVDELVGLGYRSVVVDLDGIDTVEPGALDALAGAAVRVRAASGTLAVRAASSTEALFEAAGLSALLEAA